MDTAEATAAISLSPRAQSALSLWHASATQWVPSFSGLVGMSYPGVESVARAMDIPWNEETLGLIRAMENARVREIRKKISDTQKPVGNQR